MQERDRKTVTLVLGGVRSGKSRWAQELAEKFERVAYIATAQAVDGETRAKIRRHQEDRPKQWQTFEEPLELARVVVDHATEIDLLLIDCQSIYVANLLETAEADPGSIELRIDSLVAALSTVPVAMVLVSNEVGWGVVPRYAAGRKYRDAMRELNRRVTAIADNMVPMVAVLPIVLKGSIEVQP